MNENLICHLNNNKVIFNIKDQKYYKYDSRYENAGVDYKYRLKKLHEIGQNFDWTIEEKYKPLLEKTYLAHSMRRHYRLDLYQTPILPEVAVRRALLVSNNPKDIILVGDDDLVSVPLALLGHNVTVLDADEYLLELINTLNKEFNININVLKCNMLDKIDVKHMNRYDILFSDPVSTYEGFDLFIGRGLDMLKKEGTAYIAVNHRLSRIFEKFCNDSNINILRNYKRFCNSYNHHFCIIDDVADMYEVNKGDDFKNRYDFGIPCNVDIFKSQSNLRYSLKMELFRINQTNLLDEIKAAINKIESVDDFKFEINRCDGKDNIYFIVIDNEDKMFMNIAVYKDVSVSISMEIGVNYNISLYKKIIRQNITHNEIIEEQFISGLENVSGRVEMNMNCL